MSLVVLSPLTDTVHMVRSAARSAPSTGNPGAGGAANTSSAPPNNPSAAQGVPSSFGAGQAFGTDPLAALNRADLAGPHMAHLGRNMFEGFGMNPNDPNMLMTAMQSDDFRNQMRSMLSRPEVIDQIIASNPQLAAMPGVRELFRSEQFREYLLDPQSMARAAQMASSMREGGGAGGAAGGLGGLGGLGGFGGAGGGAGGGGAAPQWPPPGAFGGQEQGQGQGQQGGQEAGAGAAAQQNPFAAFGGGGGGGGGGGMPPFDPAL